MGFFASLYQIPVKPENVNLSGCKKLLLKKLKDSLEITGYNTAALTELELVEPDMISHMMCEIHLHTHTVDILTSRWDSDCD